jgi:hypothetical protein
VTNVTLARRRAGDDRSDDHEEGLMHANFDANLPIDKDHRERVRASGPLNWDPHAVPPTGTSCRIAATITQAVNGTVVVATESWNRNYDSGDPSWDGEVRASNGRFQPGGATASGVITVTTPAAPAQSTPWGPQAVTLTIG